MTYQIQGEQPFQILATNFSIGPSVDGYTLQISADGKNYSDLFSVGANVTRMVTGVASGSYYRLKNNTGKVSVNWERQCNDGGGSGGGSGTQGPQGEAGPQGPQGADGAQGPAGSGSQGDNSILKSVSALPTTASTEWVEFQDDTFYEAREDNSNDGTYLIHWNNGENYTGVKCADGEITGSGYGMEYDEDLGKWKNRDNANILAWVEDGKLYWVLPYIITWLDAYGTGANKQGLSEVSGADAQESSVAALQGTQGLYQVVGGQWASIGGMQGPQGIEGAQGPAGGGQGGDSSILKAVSGTPEEAVLGDVFAMANASGEGLYQMSSAVEITLANYIIYKLDKSTFNAWTDIRVQIYDNNNDLCTAGYIRANANDEIEYYDYQWEGHYLIDDFTDSWSTQSMFANMHFLLKGNDLYMYTANDWVGANSRELLFGNGEYTDYVATSGYADTTLVPQLVGGYVEVDTLDGLTGEEGAIYKYGDQLFVWDNNSGYTGEWTSSFGNAQWNNIGFRFGAIPEGQKIFEFKDFNGSVWRSINYEGGNLVLREADNTFVQSAATGTTVTEFYAYNSGRGLRVKFEKNYIGFTQNNQYVSYQNVWDGSVNGGHFVPVEKTNYPYFYEGGSGIPTWDEKGRIIKGEGINRKWFQINGSSYRSRIEMAYFGNYNFPGNIWAPTTVGTSGQVLVSSGDADTAPTWATMIKAVSITSDAYEALTTKDPNTLYLIVD